MLLNSSNIIKYVPDTLKMLLHFVIVKGIRYLVRLILLLYLKTELWLALKFFLNHFLGFGGIKKMAPRSTIVGPFNIVNWVQYE